ncbi:hypothetical protein BCV72DRAFT_222822 [Rhizopus microsporus var. microsporus]|uniref:Uncharacterized protein n=1 Tax=Rhizopus microsporus var. microsporus TaxID=86635 RepID=A0A1X0RCW4_RHIZD|nr:hypothetical protein BCV72DRAFT_222822 [Rhizopus microsporus var. microsporus]
MKYWIYALLLIISIQIVRCVEEDDTSLFRQVDERRHPEVDDDDIEFKSMQDVTEGEEYIDDDSSLSEINAKINNEDNDEEEENDELDEEEEEDDDEDDRDELENEEDEEEFFVFQNAETVEYFDNFPRTEDKQKDDHTNDDLSELPSKQERPGTTAIPWQRVEPHSSNEFYQDTPIYTPEEKLNPESNRIYGIIGLFILWALVIVARKKLGNTDSAWSFKNYNDKDYCLPLHNRYLKSEMKSC